MGKVINLHEAQAALDRAAAGNNRAGRFALKANMPNVKSSMMTRVEYDDDRSELDITFIGGKTYRYFDVPPDVYDGLWDAGSKGEFFNDCIKDKYEFREIVPRPRWQP
jgi:hypothetical protein